MDRDGDEVLQWDVRVGPIRFEGEVIGLIVMTDNVTEQRRVFAEAFLARADAQVRDIERQGRDLRRIHRSATTWPT